MIGRDRRGAIALITALLAVPLVAIVGIAVDGARAWLLQSRLITALDAAALAGARNINLPAGQRDAEIGGMFWANFGPRVPDPTPAPAIGGSRRGFLESTTVLDPPVPSSDGATLRLQARSIINTTFARVIGVPTMTVSALAEARRADLGMELSLVLDVTGSMGSNATPSPVGSVTTNGTNIDALRLAASDLVNILYGSRETVPNLWVSVVPYTTTVNIGAQRSTWLADGSRDFTRYAPVSWMGCIEARASSGNDQTDATPANEPFQPYFWASTLGKYTTVTGGAVPGDNDWAPSITGPNPVTEMYQDVRENNTAGPNTGCPQAPILPLTAERSRVLSRIMALRSTFKGGTMHNVGMQAGWFTLSPRWRGLWTVPSGQPGDSSPANLPLDYRTPYMQKVVVLMTDGQANWNDWNGGAPGDCSDTSTNTRATPSGAAPLRPLGCPAKAVYPSQIVVAPNAPPISGSGGNNTDYSGYGRALENRLGVSRGAVTTELNARMTRVCAAMKQQGIIIYTVTFNLTDPATQALFQGCASKPEFWFNSPTQADLRAAFRQIGSQLANLRLIR